MGAESKNRDPSPPGQDGLETKKCPQCGSSLVVNNGSYATKNRGLVRRFICRACGHTWREYEKRSDLFEEARFVDPDDSVLEAFALVAMGLPLGQVEGLAQRKAETIQDRLSRCLEQKGVWDRIVKRLPRSDRTGDRLEKRKCYRRSSTLSPGNRLAGRDIFSSPKNSSKTCGSGIGSGEGPNRCPGV